MFFFFFKQKTAYEMRISDWSSDVCSSDLYAAVAALVAFQVCFALSWGGIVWIVLGEMFPLRWRGTAMGIAVFATEITSVVVGAVFPILLQQGAAAMFFGFSAMGVLAFLWADRKSTRLNSSH